MNQVQPTGRRRKTGTISSPNKSNHPALSPHEVRRVSVAAVCDQRTVVKYLWGFSQTENVRDRISAALRDCGYERLVGTREQRQRASQSESAERVR